MELVAVTVEHKAFAVTKVGLTIVRLLLFLGAKIDDLGLFFKYAELRFVEW